jgi:RNA polymerase sigma factor (sigma-70 family)
MQGMTDRELLEKYRASGSEEAFAEIVQRYTGMVYGTCQRILGDDDKARDATQATFLALTHKGRKLPRSTVLSGWLFQAAKYAAWNALRAEQRRREHEREAAAMRVDTASSEAAWKDMRPVLDAAIATLPENQRRVIVLRYLAGKKEREIASELSWAQGRVAITLSRALEALRRRLGRKGVAVSTSILGAALLTADAAQAAAPAGLAAAVQSACAGSAAPAVLAIEKGIQASLAWVQLKAAAAVVIAAAGVGTLVTAGAVMALRGPERPSEHAIWFVAPNGKPDNAGTQKSPWDLKSALSGEQKKIAPGHTVRLMNGVYKVERSQPGAMYEVRLAGTPEKLVIVDGIRGERVVIDGGFKVVAPSVHLWICNIEFAMPDPAPAESSGGIILEGVKDCRLINLVVHNTGNAITLTDVSGNTEVNGCVVYDNGWKDSFGRGAGACIDGRNIEGRMTVSNCILTTGEETRGTMHLANAGRAMEHVLFTENIAYEGGPMLIGGAQPSRDIKVIKNYFFRNDVQLGAPRAGVDNADCEVRDNILLCGRIHTSNFRTVVNTGNDEVGEQRLYHDGVTARLLPDRHILERAHLAVYNWDREPSGTIDFSPFLAAGEPFRLMDPKDIHGKPVFSGKAGAGGRAVIPLKGEFAAFVVFKGGVQ